MTLNEAIRKATSERNITSVEIAAELTRAGLPTTQTTVDRWLSGQCAPRAEMIPAIAHALGVTPNDLFGVETPALAAVGE